MVWELPAREGIILGSSQLSDGLSLGFRVLGPQGCYTVVAVSDRGSSRTPGAV